ncbi:hypothetical protein H9633_10155 [Microbacterium sp. Re1]|uniref:DUF222 domain-containing protein n=1 Tax=Microbacterium commune TaxID=2762219 RepID=A0ABR8W6L6_9MICO|nr:hypothetical protein [Microbacterium commune]MBD8012659.1 hypothetical protein [Microbacterium commune]
MNMRNPHLNFVITALKATGAKLPKAITTALEEQGRIVAAAREARTHTGGYASLVKAWTSAVLDGRDPAEDPNLLRALLNNALADGDLEYAAGNAVNDRAVDNMRAVQDDILNIFKTAFDAAGVTLKYAQSILGNIDLDDTTAIFQLGPVAVQAHQDAQEARRLTRLIDSGWTALNQLTGFTIEPERVTRWADSDIDTWERVRRVKDAWQVVAAGCTLDLAIDRDTINARIERIARERHERETLDFRNAQAARRAQGALVLDGIEKVKEAMR